MPKLPTHWECDICGKKADYLPDKWFHVNKQIKGFENAVFCSTEHYEQRITEELRKFENRR